VPRCPQPESTDRYEAQIAQLPRRGTRAGSEIDQAQDRTHDVRIAEDEEDEILLQMNGVADGTRTHDNRNHNPGDGGGHDRIGQRLGHAHEAGVGKAHEHVRVLLHELEHRLNVAGQLEGGERGIASKQRAQAGRAAHSNEVKGLRQGGFARAPGRCALQRLRRGSAAMSIAIAEQGDDNYRINKDVCMVDVNKPDPLQGRAQSCHNHTTACGQLRTKGRCTALGYVQAGSKV